MGAYKNLENYCREIGVLESINSILHWDTMVIMKPNSGQSRSAQINALQEVITNKYTNNKLQETLQEAQNEDNLDEWQKANLREIAHKIELHKLIPQKLLAKLNIVTTNCELKWRKARAENDFNVVKNELEQVVNLTREMSQLRSEHYKIPAYEALLNIYDRGQTTKELDKIFTEIRNFLSSFVDKVQQKQGKKPDLKGHYPTQLQEEMTMQCAKDFNFDFTKGRIDSSLHPFCGGTPDDSRITTRYDDDCFAFALLSTIHEVGHATYEGNLPEKWRYQPLGVAQNMAIHESQSLLFERQIGHSLGYIEYIHPRFNIYKNKDLSAQNIYKYINYIEKSHIRTKADEVTYPLHIIIRYNLEKELINGNLNVRDLSEAWREQAKEILGIVPSCDNEGCLQDIHWYSGAFGYFSTYTLGAMIASQLMSKITDTLPNVDKLIANGDFTPIISWLREKIHSKGHFFNDSNQLLESATGESLNPGYFTRYLQDKYIG